MKIRRNTSRSGRRRALPALLLTLILGTSLLGASGAAAHGRGHHTGWHQPSHSWFPQPSNQALALSWFDVSKQTVAAAAEQLSASIQEISRQVSQATNAVRAAGATTDRSAAEIEGLAAAGQRIGDVVGLIQAIAAHVTANDSTEMATPDRPVR